MLIGNGGNDPSDKEYTMDAAANRLLEAGGPSPIGFFAVAVGDQNKAAYERFKKQTETLAQRLAEQQILQIRKSWGKDELPAGVDAAARKLSGQSMVSTGRAPPAIGMPVWRERRAMKRATAS